MYLCRRPTAALAPWVECLWLVSDEPLGAKERIAPSESIEVGINLCADVFQVYDAAAPNTGTRRSGAVASGTRSRPVVIDPRELTSVIGVRFRPGGAVPFLGVPADRLADTHLDLEVLWGPAAQELRERLCLATTPAERLGLLEHALLGRLQRRWERHYAVSFALERFRDGREAGRSVRDVAREAGLSQRRFIQVFTRDVGMPPKLFCRLRRFRLALDASRRTPEPNWALLAAECGYYDQSHLIHDFRAFSGLSPTEFVRLRSDCAFQNHATLVD